MYYFNFVQTPFFAETEPAVRSGAVQKLVPRALWWFRWGAMGTVVVGLIYLILWWAQLGWAITSWTVTILTGGTMGIIMFLNVWLVIWPNQKIVIGSAVTVAGGGQADPKAAPAGRRAGLASRTNTVFSIPLLFFMGAASHYSMFSNPTTGGIWAWLIITGIVIVLIEINALVGSAGSTKKPLDSVQGAITFGFVLWLARPGVSVLAGVCDRARCCSTRRSARSGSARSGSPTSVPDVTRAWSKPLQQIVEHALLGVVGGDTVMTSVRRVGQSAARPGPARRDFERRGRMGFPTAARRRDGPARRRTGADRGVRGDTGGHLRPGLNLTPHRA